MNEWFLKVCDNLNMEICVLLVIMPYFVGSFCDLPLGLFIVRGDNVVVLGEIDDEAESRISLQRVTQEELMEKIAQGKKKASGVDWSLE